VYDLSGATGNALVQSSRTEGRRAFETIAPVARCVEAGPEQGGPRLKHADKVEQRIHNAGRYVTYSGGLIIDCPLIEPHTPTEGAHI